jgi:hypothetical protein
MTPDAYVALDAAVIDRATDITLPESSATLRRVLLVDTRALPKALQPRSPRHIGQIRKQPDNKPVRVLGQVCRLAGCSKPSAVCVNSVPVGR